MFHIDDQITTDALSQFLENQSFFLRKHGRVMFTSPSHLSQGESATVGLNYPSTWAEAGIWNNVLKAHGHCYPKTTGIEQNGRRGLWCSPGLSAQPFPSVLPSPAPWAPLVFQISPCDPSQDSLSQKRLPHWKLSLWDAVISATGKSSVRWIHEDWVSRDSWVL